MASQLMSPIPKKGPEVLVIGAGVIGLSTAHELVTRGYKVQIWAAKPSLKTTSRIAAAFWSPFHTTDKQSDCETWALQSHTRFCELEKIYGTEDCGVCCTPALDLSDRSGSSLHATPSWIKKLEGSRPATVEELPPGYSQGQFFPAPVIEMPVYLGWLNRQLLNKDVTTKITRIQTLTQALAHCPLVINASGLGSKELCQDSQLIPVRGQLLIVNKRLSSRLIIDESIDSTGQRFAYLIPRSHDTVLGTSLEPGQSEVTINEAINDQIVRDARHLLPDLPSHFESQSLVGIRPVRNTIRLEVESLGDQQIVVHNYGHGGAGVTLSWGCAKTCVDLFESRLSSL